MSDDLTFSRPHMQGPAAAMSAPEQRPVGPESPAQPATAPPDVVPRRPTGRWYFVLTLASAGLLAAVPFWHAAGRLKRRAVRRLAIRYTVADAALFFLGTLAPQRPDGTTADGPFSDVLALGAIAVIVVGWIQLRSLRREVYSGPDGEPASEDPLARALAARTRRQETRELLAKDPALGRELGIGRPDLGKGYDDGGLVDLNTAPASVIAQVCGIDSSYAERIVAARGGPRGYYNNLADLFVDVNLPPSVQQQVQERAVL